jgi:integrase/recombinase XerD
MTTELATTDNRLAEIVQMVTDAVDSPHTRRAYGRALAEFLTWHTTLNTKGFTRAGVNAYRESLRTAGVSDSSVNQRLSAVRKLAAEAAANGLLDDQVAAGIKGVKGIAVRGHSIGNWLEKDQAEAMLGAPNKNTVKGLRDRAILAMLIGCGLRREEVVNLDVSHVQQRAGRWVLVDIVGKRNKVRSVPMAAWVKYALDCWLLAAALPADDPGPLFRPLLRGGHVQPGRLTSQAIWDVVQKYAPKDVDGKPIKLAPHDLRRTYAKLSRTGGAALEQIQLTLGHESLDTTRRYLGTELDLKRSPSDMIELNV